MTQHSAVAAPGTAAPGTASPDSAAGTGHATAPTSRPRIALVGVHGFGERHLANLARLEAAGAVELVAVADPNPPAGGHTRRDRSRSSTPSTSSWQPDTAPDVVILATPIQTHAPLALAALAAGSDVYVEKPPVASLAQFEDMLAAAEASGTAGPGGFPEPGLPRAAGHPRTSRGPATSETSWA